MAETPSAAGRALLEETLAYLRADADDGPLFEMIERHLDGVRAQARAEARREERERAAGLFDKWAEDPVLTPYEKRRYEEYASFIRGLEFVPILPPAPEPATAPEPIIMEADFSQPRTIVDLAAEQQQFLASLPDDLVDVPLPPDDTPAPVPSPPLARLAGKYEGKPVWIEEYRQEFYPDNVQDGWIRVEDRLPESGKDLILAMEYKGEIIVLVGYQYESQWRGIHGGEIVGNVIAWRPLPEPPAGEEGSEK